MPSCSRWSPRQAWRGRRVWRASPARRRHGAGRYGSSRRGTSTRSIRLSGPRPPRGRSAGRPAPTSSPIRTVLPGRLAGRPRRRQRVRDVLRPWTDRRVPRPEGSALLERQAAHGRELRGGDQPCAQPHHAGAGPGVGDADIQPEHRRRAGGHRRQGKRPPGSSPGARRSRCSSPRLDRTFSPASPCRGFVPSRLSSPRSGRRRLRPRIGAVLVAGRRSGTRSCSSEIRTTTAAARAIRPAS